ncbi:MAG: ATP-grasp enzyme, partial [Pseudonocardia sediminis]
MTSVPKTAATLALLGLALPLNLAVTAVGLLRGLVTAPVPEVAAEPRTIMISGGKMTKALALARSFHRAGHRVVLVESAKYRLTGHRFSRAVDRFHVVPTPESDGYVDALVAVARAEDVDVFVPVSSPVASYHDALAKKELSALCDVVHLDADMVETLDDKYRFTTLAASMGLGVPDRHRITDPQQVIDFDWAGHGAGHGAGAGRTYILKSLAYDPVRRMDLTELPRPTPAETAAFVRSLPISPDNPWILQEFVRGQEYCTHATVRDGDVQLHCCCPS